MTRIRKILVLILAASLVGCLQDHSQPRVEEINGVNIEFPTYGQLVTQHMAIRDLLTTEQTKILASALPVITSAVLFANFENHATERLEELFSNADVTFVYKYLNAHSIEDRRGGFSRVIQDWDVTSSRIVFTVYTRMINDKDDGYWEGEEDYDIKFRYSFASSSEGEWQFVKNEFAGFSNKSKN